MVSSENGITNIPDFYIDPIDQDIKNQPKNIFGYYVNSTAPRNVEDPHDVPDIKQFYDEPKPSEVKKCLREIAEHLLNSNEPQLIVSVHGYSSNPEDAEASYRKTYKYATEILQRNKEAKNYIFLGYRWPSEKPFQKNLGILRSLPTLLIGILLSGMVFSLIAFLLIVTNGQNYDSATLTIMLRRVSIILIALNSTGILLQSLIRNKLAG